MTDMKSLREKIDRLDKQIVRLLNKRAKYADDIGKIKEKLGLEVYSPEREKQVIENVSNENPGPLTNEAISRVYERIIDESRRLERESAGERRTSISQRQSSIRNLFKKLFKTPSA
jgi:chorismate mutase